MNELFEELPNPRTRLLDESCPDAAEDAGALEGLGVLFSKFEKRMGLYDREYNGFPYWQHVRFEVFCRATNPHQYGQKRIGVKKVASKAEALVAACRGAMAFAALGKRDVVCVSNSPQNDRFFSTWSFPENVSVGYFETCSARGYGPLFKPNIKLFAAKAKIKKVFYKTHDASERVFLHELSSQLQKEFGRTMTAEELEDKIISALCLHSEGLLYYKKLFKKIGCKALVVICYYQPPLYSAYEVARDMGITIIELQHGAIRNHECYWFEDQRGVNNYTPDYFLSFGEWHTEGTRMLPQTRRVAVGFPYQESEVQRYLHRGLDEKRIIIYPDARLEFDIVTAEFAQMALEAGYKITVKLHPSQMEDYKELYPNLSSVRGIEMVADQTKSIYYWLTSARHHVLANSTVGVEALAVPTARIYIAEFVPHYTLEPLLENGSAVGFRTAKELLCEISASQTTVDANYRASLWKPKSRENIELFFSDLAASGWK